MWYVSFLNIVKLWINQAFKFSFKSVKKTWFLYITRAIVKPIATWQFAAYPFTTGTYKSAKISNKNSSFNWVLSIYPESTNASHSINLFTNSCHHISTNSKAPPYPHNNQQHPQLLYPWLAPDVMAAMLVHWTIAKRFREFDSILLQNESDIFLLVCATTWQSNNVSASHEFAVTNG